MKSGRKATGGTLVPFPRPKAIVPELTPKEVLDYAMIDAVCLTLNDSVAALDLASVLRTWIAGRK